MVMRWNSRNDRFDLNGEIVWESFQEHNGYMREFRSSHADVVMVNGPRRHEAAFLESLPPLGVRCFTMETGGAALPNDTTDQSNLVLIWKVALYKLSES